MKTWKELNETELEYVLECQSYKDDVWRIKHDEKKTLLEAMASFIGRNPLYEVELNKSVQTMFYTKE